MIRTHDNERQMTHFEAYEVESEGEDTNNNNNNAYKKKTSYTQHASKRSFNIQRCVADYNNNNIKKLYS